MALHHAGDHHVGRRGGRLERVRDGVPQVVVLERRRVEAARGRVDEHERPGRLGGLPERLEAVVAEEHAAHARRHFDALQHAGAHQLAQLAGGELGVLERQRAKRVDALGMAPHEAGERLVLDARPGEPLLGLGVVVEQRDPGTEQHAIDARRVLRGEDAGDVDELLDGGADLLAAHFHDLTPGVVAPDPRAPGLVAGDLRDDHVRVHVERHALTPPARSARARPRSPAGPPPTRARPPARGAGRPSSARARA